MSSRLTNKKQALTKESTAAEGSSSINDEAFIPSGGSVDGGGFGRRSFRY
jgi:hypothetical protein